MICKAGKPRLHLAPDRGGMEERNPGGLEGLIGMSEGFDEEDAEQAGSLPMRRRDPFDRFLIAQGPGGRARPPH